MTMKEPLLKIVESLPDDARIEDAMERLYLLYKVEQGIAQLDAGQGLSQEEVRRQMAKWLE